MKTNINNYKVNKLILNGDYICQDQQENLILLAKSTHNQISPSYRNLSVDNLILPVQLTYVEDSLFRCFPLSSKLIHCATKIRAYTFSFDYIMKMIKKLCNIAIEIKENKYLKEQALSCFDLENLWLTKKQVYLIWNPRSQKQIYSQDKFIKRVGEIFFFMISGKNYKSLKDLSYISNENLRALIYKMTSQQDQKINFFLIQQFFQQIYIPVNTRKRIKPKPQIIDMKKKFAQQTKIYLDNKKPWIDINHKQQQAYLQNKRNIKIEPVTARNPINTLPYQYPLKKKRASLIHSSANKYYQTLTLDKRTYDLSLSKNKIKVPERYLRASQDETLQNGNDSIKQLNNTQVGEIGRQNIIRDKQKLQTIKMINRHSALGDEEFYRQKMEMKLLTWNKRFLQYRQKRPLFTYKGNQQTQNFQFSPQPSPQKKTEQEPAKVNTTNKNKNQQFTKQKKPNNRLSIQKYQLDLSKSKKLEEKIEQIKKVEISSPQQKEKNISITSNLESNRWRITLQVSPTQIQKLIQQNQEFGLKSQHLISRKNTAQNIRKQQQQRRLNELKLKLQRQKNEIQQKEKQRKQKQAQRKENEMIQLRKKEKQLKQLLQKEKKQKELREILQRQRLEKERREWQQIERQKKSIEQKQRQQRQRKQNEQKQRLQKIRKQQQQKQRIQKQKIEKQRQEIERIQREKRQKQEKQRLQLQRIQRQRIQRQRQQRQRIDKQQKQRQQRQRIEKQRQQKQRIEKQRQQKQQKQRKQRQKIQRQQKQRLQRDRIQKQKLQKQLKQKQERQKLEKQRLQQERLKKIQQLQQQKIRIQKLQLQRIQKQAALLAQKQRKLKQQADIKLKKQLQQKQSLNKLSSSQKKQKKQSVMYTTVSEYINFINVLGQTVGKSQKAVKNINGLQWLTGIYFIYKRFYRQRIKIQKYLQNGINKLFRKGNQIDEEEFKKWLQTDEKSKLFQKIKKQNKQIYKAVQKMSQIIMQRKNEVQIIRYAPLNIQDIKQSYLAVQYVLNQYQVLSQLQNVTDEIKKHQTEILDSLFIIAQLDDKQIKKVDMKERKLMKDVGEYLHEQEKYIQQLRRIYQDY